MEIVKFTTDDLDVYQSVARQTFFDAYERNTDAENLQKYIDDNFALPVVTAELDDPNCALFYLREGNDILGYIKLRWNTSHDLLKGKVIELQRIYVVKEFYGKGYGKILLEHAEQFGRENGFEWIWLCVWYENAGAIRFYEKAGWEKFGMTRFKFGDVVYDDPVFKKKL